MKDITLVAIEFQTHELTARAMAHSLNHMDVKEVLVISDRDFFPGARFVHHEPVNGIAEYANIMLKGVAEHVDTGHALYVQWDGMVNDARVWTDDFLKYDYIGAPWYQESEGFNVGNGGFSLRSKRLLDACQDPVISLTPEIPVAEDAVIGKVNREYLEKQYHVSFAPTMLAKQFSYELGYYQASFGFHGLWNVYNFMTDQDLDFYTETQSYAGWNLYKWHHVLYAVIRRGRMDLYEFLLTQLMENNPELLAPISHWLQHDAQHNMEQIIIL